MVPRYLPRDHSEIHWRTNLPVGRIRHRHIHQVDPKGSPQAHRGQWWRNSELIGFQSS